VSPVVMRPIRVVRSPRAEVREPAWSVERMRGYW
jgi:hypothetical protein